MKTANSTHVFTIFDAEMKPVLVNPDLVASPEDCDHLMDYNKRVTFNMEQVKTKQV